MKLIDFLDAKPLYYDEIDYDRMPRTYEAVKDLLPKPKVIHVVGTNGKGTTGRFIANVLWHAGYRVGHYTSPHILQFNERIWHNGENASDAQLDAAHETLFSLLGKARADALSYFEYTTLLAMVVYRDCEWVVLEAGLGGEHDATNVFEKSLSVFTPIDFDHQAFLGDTIESIAATKLRSMGPKAVIGEQPHEAVYDVCDEIARDKGAECCRVKEILSDADMDEVQRIAAAQELPAYLSANMALAAAALQAVGIGWKAGWFEGMPLFGRMSRIGNNVIVDVGHNPLAAEAIARSLYPKKVVLVYNTYKDKEYHSILKILEPVIARVEIIEVDEDRIAPREALETALEAREIDYGPFEGINEEESYLVFGSFSVVEAFLREYHA